MIYIMIVEVNIIDGVDFFFYLLIDMVEGILFYNLKKILVLE